MRENVIFSCVAHYNPPFWYLKFRILLTISPFTDFLNRFYLRGRCISWCRYVLSTLMHHASGEIIQTEENRKLFGSNSMTINLIILLAINQSNCPCFFRNSRKLSLSFKFISICDWKFKSCYLRISFKHLIPSIRSIAF